jgi:hypothetical protein
MTIPAAGIDQGSPVPEPYQIGRGIPGTAQIITAHLPQVGQDFIRHLRSPRHEFQIRANTIINRVFFIQLILPPNSLKQAIFNCQNQSVIIILIITGMLECTASD